MTEPTDIEWFEEWFNSPYYHLLYGNRDEGEAAAFIDKLLKKIGLAPEARVLDLACGKGRHSRQINSNGFEVVGIDLSVNSINGAKQFENDGLEFFVHDMRQLFWKDHFNLVVNLFTSFGYFHNREDDLKMMSGVYDSLKPSGLFVIDFMNAIKVVRNLVDHEEKTIDGVSFIIDRVVEGGIIKKTIKVIDGDSEQVFVEEVDELYMSDFEGLLSQVGFTIQNTYGDYGLGDFDERESDRLIIVAAKHGNG